MTRRLNTKKTSYGSESDKYSVTVARGGKPVEGIQSERITNIEEEVERLEIGSHLYAWLADRLPSATSQPIQFDWGTLRELLSVCEKVLHASHLVPEKPFKVDSSDWRETSREALSNPRKIIKSVGVAHNLLPIKSRYASHREEYGEEYLKQVDEMRLWIGRMFAERANGSAGTLHLSLY